VALLEDHVRPDPGWISAAQEVHRTAFAGIGGAIENGIHRTLNWATYFADLGRYHNPLPAGESGYASLVNISYKRNRLNLVHNVWKRRFHEAEVHGALLALGERLAMSSEPVVRQYRPDVEFSESLREFFIWGRSFGGARARGASAGKRIFYACLTPLVPAVLLFRSGLDTARKRRLMWPWVKSLPIGVALTCAWAAGELAGYTKPEQRVTSSIVTAPETASRSHSLSVHQDSSTKEAQ
jgi:hypothetical protein